MKENWDLSVFYKGFDDPAFAADLASLPERIKAISEAIRAESDDDAAKIRGILTQLEQLGAVSEHLGLMTQLTLSCDADCEAANAAMTPLMQADVQATQAMSAFSRYLATVSDLDALIESDPVLRANGFFLKNAARQAAHMLPETLEGPVLQMQLSGGEAFSQLRDKLDATLLVHYRDGQLPLSAVRALAYDADAAVRRDAYEAELACYDRIKDSVAFALNSIKLETLSDCALRGYPSPLDRTLEQSHMKRETLQAMLGAMEEYMPKFRQYLKAKGKALGHENGLPWYDLFAPMGASAARYTAEDAKAILVELFSSFDEELAQMVERAFDEAWIDFYPRDGKTGGAFCAGVECLGQSRILTNFDGTFGSVVTLAHELGHAFHNQCLREQRPLNRDYSMPVAETASTFNECVVMAAAISRAKSREEKLALIESQLQDATQIICDIDSRYLFESMVLENRGERFMDADTLCGMMTKTQELTYGDGLDPNFRHPYMWICKSHYYGATFYNFPYAFGGLFARGLYARYEQEGASFVPKYKQLLRTTPVATAEDTALVAGIDLTDRAFWRSALQTIADQIDLFCQLVSEKEES